MNGALDLVAFAGVMALGQFSPGPDMLLLTRTALRRGGVAGVEMAFGIASGLLFHSTIAFAGLAVAFQRIPELASALRWVAAGYLFWISYQLLKEHFVKWYSGSMQQNDAVVSNRRPFVLGLMCNLLNPKAALFLAAVSTPFLIGARPVWWPVMLGAIVVLQGGILWAIWALLLQWEPLSRRYRKMQSWIDVAFALALIVLAIGLLCK